MSDLEEKYEHLKKECRMLRDECIELYVDNDNLYWRLENVRKMQSKSLLDERSNDLLPTKFDF